MFSYPIRVTIIKTKLCFSIESLLEIFCLVNVEDVCILLYKAAYFWFGLKQQLEQQLFMFDFDRLSYGMCFYIYKAQT